MNNFMHASRNHRILTKVECSAIWSFTSQKYGWQLYRVVQDAITENKVRL